MNKPNGEAASQPPLVMIRPGLLERLRLQSTVRSDEAFARLIGVSRPTYQRLKAGEEPTLRTIVGIAQAFGLGLGEVVQIVQPDAAAEESAAA
ncbi:helix-turn-helix transcriptional regulator [Microbacterium gilvum]|uniref:HTH cro/C1-type domain-containing protein n=1 Tax=Microbacterium gilvum TaxID=1336204 RepID=A0ABP8ZP97_9MICO